ncbi:hypothetical protein AS850_02230 [Frondihabitans sp. 762G35]|uniref:SRPBCC domain-containing protein n=1 Tax=Frondihabitans sp. 762G35 TaxID=1446794 RepID=UPI000D22CB9B|nr:SRPBCC domain-containing protein [Frondihabitans sp. 762G35]ARC55895.1 hypothetical protein AS850_02230 [Frondihabitans sp. 762G35]
MTDDDTRHEHDTPAEPDARPGHDVASQRGTTHVRSGAQTISHRREFDAPASRVQRAHTDPALFPRWMGPRGTTVRLDRFEAVTGGAFRYSVVGGDGAAWTFFGSYHEVRDGLVTHTWQYEGETDVSLETLRFRDLAGGRSVLEVTSAFSSEAACEAMVASGLDGGMDENFARLDEVLAG